MEMEPQQTSVSVQDFKQLTIADLHWQDKRSKAINAYCLENKLLTTQNPTKQFLQEFENYSSSSQLALLTHIKQTLVEVPTNAQILSNNDVIQTIINLCLNTSGKIQEQLLSIADHLFQCSTLQDDYMRWLLRKIVCQFNESKVVMHSLLTGCNLLSSLYESKAVGSNEPKNVMYFHGQSDFRLENSKSTFQWPFYKGYTVAMWLYLEQVRHQPEMPLSKLYTFYAEGSGGIEAYFIDDKLFYRVLGANYTEPHIGSNGLYLCSIQRKKWHFIAIQHEQSKTLSRSKLNVFLDKKVVNSVNIDPPKPSTKAKTKIVFFDGLYCRSSSICLFLSTVGMKIEQLSKNVNSIDYLKDQKALVLEPRGGKVHQRSGFAYSNVGTLVKNRKMNCTHILPFFYLASFLKPSSEPILDKILHLVVILFRSSKENQVQAERTHFIKMLSSLMMSIPEKFFGDKIFNVLLHIKACITQQKLLDQFICHFLWRLLKSKAPIQKKLQIFQLIKNCFTQNLIHNSTQLGFDQVLSLVADLEPRGVQCCEKHQRAIQPQMQTPIVNKQEQLLQGLRQFMELLFSNPKIDLSIEVPKIIRLFYMRYSPCFITKLLSMLRKLITDRLSDKLSEDNIKKTLKGLAEKKAHLVFMHLIANSPFVDVKADSLRMIYFLLSCRVNIGSEPELSAYISQVLWKIHQIPNNKPVAKEITEIRKVNSMPEVEQEGPQAPSMSNRRNPSVKFTFGETKESVMEEEKTVDPDVKPKEKKKFLLNIDTDKINELYSYGGEKGKQVVMDQDDDDEQIENIRQLARKCIKAMHSETKKPDVHTTKENKKIGFPVAPLNSTRNQDLTSGNRQRGFPSNLRIIQQSQKSASEKKSRRMSDFSEDETRRTPSKSPSQRKQQNQNMLIMYSALLECTFQKEIGKVIAPSPRIASISCFEMTMIWGLNCSNEIKVLILTDLIIMLQQKVNLDIVSGNKQLLNFVMDTIYCALASSSEQLLKLASGLLSTIHQKVFLTDTDPITKFSHILRWPISNEKLSDFRDPNLQLLTVRYCWYVVLQSTADALNSDGNQTLWQNNFSILCLLTEQLVYSNYNYGATAVERRQQNGLSYLVSSSEVPLLVRDKFPYDWIDYSIVVKLQQIFNKYFTTKTYQNLKRNPNNEKFIESSLDNKNNLQILRDSQFYLNSQQPRGIIIPLCHLYSSFVEFNYENHLNCQDEEIELICIGKLLLVLAEVTHVKNASNKRSQIIQAFMAVLKTSVCLCRNLQLMLFFLAVKNFITSRYVQPGSVDSNCPLNLVSLEIANMKFPGRANFMDASKYPSVELDFRIFLEEVEIQLPPRIVEKKESLPNINQKQIIERLEDEMLDLRTSTSEAERERHSAMTIIEDANHRKSLSLFKKAWKRMRSYNEVWAHPNFYFQVDTLYNKNIWNYDKQQPIRPYKIRVNKQQSKSKARFLLEAKLVQPNIVLERENSLRQKGVINFDRALIGLSKLLGQAEGKGQHQTSSRFLSLGKCLVELFHPLRTEVDSPLTLKRADLITTLTARAGYMGITAQKLVFVYMYYEQRDSHLAIVKHRLRSTCNFTKEWPLEFIKQVYRRRYVNRRSALQIFFLNGQSVFFNFPQGDCEEVSKKIVKLRQTKSPNLTYYKTLDPKKIIEGSNIVKRWDKYEMSNFEYIMSLNCLSGRSYKDVSQYHVFPWTLTSFAEKLDLSSPNSYRDFNKNMGSMGSENRVNMFQTRYQNFDPHMDGHKFHFGTHYSSPGIIYHYLVRLSPFTEGAIELQSGRFDLPDRLFFSIEDSFKNCTTEYSDVRQLIPQFFILPEMFLNEQKYDLGVMQSKKRVNNVQLPQWAHDNPYLYVMKLRRAFQMQYVSRNINKWIDLIFGYRQRGQEAIKAMNVFFHLTYEDSVNFQTMTDMKMKKAIETQIINFGQTPSQLFAEPHPPRKQYQNCQKLLTVPNINPKIYRPTNKNTGQRKIEVNPMRHSAESLIRLKWIKDSKLISVNRGGKVTYYKWYSQGLNRIPFKCAIQDEKQLDKLAKNKYDPTQYYDPSLQVDNFPLEVICSGTYILIGGIAQGKLLQIEAETGNIFEKYKNHGDSITCIKSDTRDNFVMTGDVSGDIILWRITPQGKLGLIQKMSDHCMKINSIFISNQLKSFVSCSEDGTVNMYNIITGKRIRSYRHPEGKPINNIIVSTCPLAVLMMFCNRDRMIFCYSINGQLIQRVHEVDSAHLLVPTLIKDMRSLQYVVYGNQKGEIFIRDLPFLDYPRKFTVAKDATVTNICISKDLRYIICSCSDGEMSVITDPSQKIN